MTNIGNTNSFVVTCLHQYFTFISWGGKVVMSSPHPDAPGKAHAATFSVVEEYGDGEVDPDVKNALGMLSRMCWAVGARDFVSVEKLSSDVDEEARFIVTIKKRETPQRSE